MGGGSVWGTHGQQAVRFSDWHFKRCVALGCVQKKEKRIKSDCVIVWIRSLNHIRCQAMLHALFVRGVQSSFHHKPTRYERHAMRSFRKRFTLWFQVHNWFRHQTTTLYHSDHHPESDPHQPRLRSVAENASFPAMTGWIIRPMTHDSAHPETRKKNSWIIHFQPKSN